jgi:hypothetical protein
VIHFNNKNKKKKKNNVIVAAGATLFTLATVVIAGVTYATIIAPSALLHWQYAEAMVGSDSARVVTWAPIVVTGDNIYVAWWTNKTTANNNDEVMFRASNDRGQTFGDKINLSNSPEADSTRAEISAQGQNVAVSWWETTTTTNQTSDTPVARISTDGGHTFGPVLRLGSNGTISNTSATGTATTTTTAAGGRGAEEY